MTEPRTPLPHRKVRLRRLPTVVGPCPSFDPDQAPDEPVDLFAGWLDLALVDAQARLDADPALVAPGCAVHVVEPAEVEFWQRDRQRRHVRLRLRRTERDGPRVNERLWP